MKTKSLLFPLLFVATVSAFFTQCSGNKSGEAASEHDDHDADSAISTSDISTVGKPQFEVAPVFQQQLASVFNSYLSLKEAFISSDANNVKAQAASAKESLLKTDMKLLSGAAHHDWMNYLADMEGSLKEMESSTDIEKQRTAFSTLSESLYGSIKAYGLGGATAYYEYCPMAFNNQGGYWLSDEEKIRNPYFGDKMLSCGEVKEKLQ